MADDDTTLDSRAREPFLPRWMHVVFAFFAAIAAVGALANALAADRLELHALHGGLAAALVIWCLIEWRYGGRPRE